MSGLRERGRGTSVVRYDPESAFPAHVYPEGEEILVLASTLSDGFRHAPHSREGCVVFVKLRQYAGANRPHVVMDTRSATWTPLAAGVTTLSLYAQSGFPETIRRRRPRAARVSELRAGRAERGRRATFRGERGVG